MVAPAGDLAGGVELISVEVVDGDRGSVRAQGGHGGVAEPNRFFDQRPGAVVFPEDMAGFVVRVEDGAVDAAADPDPLAEGVVDGRLC